METTMDPATDDGMAKAHKRAKILFDDLLSPVLRAQCSPYSVTCQPGRNGGEEDCYLVVVRQYDRATMSILFKRDGGIVLHAGPHSQTYGKTDPTAFQLCMIATDRALQALHPPLPAERCAA